MNDLLNTKLLDKLVPGWDKPIQIDQISTGDIVKFTIPQFIKKYPGEYKVAKKKGKYIYLEITNVEGKMEHVGVQEFTIKKV